MEILNYYTHGLRRRNFSLQLFWLSSYSFSFSWIFLQICLRGRCYFDSTVNFCVGCKKKCVLLGKGGGKISKKSDIKKLGFSPFWVFLGKFGNRAFVFKKTNFKTFNFIRSVLESSRENSSI